MQMTKTSAALHLLTEKHLPFISVLTDPTMGGVSASFAFLGDVVLAEPNASYRLCRSARYRTKPSAKPAPKASNAQNSCWKRRYRPNRRPPQHETAHQRPDYSVAPGRQSQRRLNREGLIRHSVV